MEFLLSSASQTPGWRHRSAGRWVLGLLAWAVVAVAVWLGQAESILAHHHWALQDALADRASAPELETAALLAEPADWAQTHRRVVLEGFWLAQHSVWVDSPDSRHGRAGLWVLTPLQLDASKAVLVQRGWVPRDAQKPDSAAAYETESGVVRLHGRIAPQAVPATPGAFAAAPGASGSSRIRHNLSLDRFREETGVQLQAVVLQTDASDDGLLREEPMPAVQASHHQALARWWFALAAVLGALCVWFQGLQPLRHARRKSA